MRHKLVPVILTVALVALIVNGTAMAGSRLWVVPTSIEYLDLAVGVADRLDFSNELFLLRTPGYPLLLALVFRVCGTASPTVIVLLQHGMTVATAILTALIAWHLTNRRDVTLVSGVMCACSLQVLAFADQVMSETPYAFALTASVYFIVRHLRHGKCHDLALGSGLAGVAYLFRPIGLTVVALLPAVALYRARVDRRDGSTPATAPRSLLSRCVWALFPATALIAPWWVENQVVHGANSFARCFDFALYNRAANVERGHTVDSPAFEDVHRVVREAKSRGQLAADADEGLAWTVWQAYRDVDGRPLTESSTLLGRAAVDSLRADPIGMIANTIRESAWMVLTPDSSYRYHPGGAKGMSGRRPSDAELFDSGLYLQSLDRPLRAYAHYLPLESGDKHRVWWCAVARWFYRHVEKGPPVIGIGDSLYEEIMLAFLLAGLLSLFTKERTMWAMVLAVVALQVVPSAFVAGVGPRYAVPIQPLIKLFGGLLIVTVVRVVWYSVRVPMSVWVARCDREVGADRALRASEGKSILAGGL